MDFEVPDTPDWSSPVLFHINSRSKYQVWFIAYNDKEKKLVITHGQEFGKMQTDFVKIITNTSGRTHREQAIVQAQDRYKKKIRKGYSSNKENNDKKSIKPLAMLAKEFGKVKIKRWPVAVQPKLDGVRMMVTYEEKECIPYSRGGKVWNHLKNISKHTSKLLSLLPKGCFLDGELYIMGMAQNRISGIVRTVKTRHKDYDKLQYYIFDIGGTNLTYEEREMLLVKAYKEHGKFDSCIRFVPSYRAENVKEVHELHDKFVDASFEGAIIRDLHAKYVGRRNNCLLKLKNFKDEEAEIIDIYTAKTGREEGLVLYRVKNKDDIEYNSRPRGTFEYRKNLFEIKDQLIGKMVLIRYIMVSEYGVPLHAVALRFTDRNFEGL
uniref:DNA ligase n=1 Tax=Pithovirus LCPAC404 TaxID=2506597 RepID=A0A481ZCC1_9VIRU|nr:MAG: ATP-dependent DNA ligase [Pithovirus LCPAC404]